MGRLTHTVSGDVASFRAASRVPLESLKFHFLPKQAEGTLTLENPISIEGWTGLNGKRCHKNLIKPYYTEETTYYGIPITPTANGVRVKGTAAIECAIRLSSMDVRYLDEGKKYTFSLYVNGDISGCKDPYIGYYDGSGYWGTMGSLTEANNYKLTWTVPSRYANATAPWFDMYIRIKEGSVVDFEIGLQMEAGENTTTYEPFSEVLIPITFPDGETIYGGYVDPVAGEIVATHAKVNTTWGAGWNTGENLETVKRRGFSLPVTFKGAQYLHDDGHGEYRKKTRCNVATWSWNYFGDYVHYYIDGSQATLLVPLDTTDDLEIEFCAELATPIHIPIASQDLQAFLDYNNFWSDANDITEVVYEIGESKDIEAIKKKANQFNNYFQGELIFELNADDAPVDGKWIDRVQNMPFELILGASYDSVNKIYDFSGYGLAVKKNGVNYNPLSFGHHFRIEWDVYYNRSNSPTSYIMDIGSLTSAEKAIGFKLLPKNASNITPNWKLNGNDSNPFSYNDEENRTGPIEIPLNNEYTHLVGFSEIIPYNNQYDIFRLKINDHIKKYSTLIPKIEYGPPWSSQINWISVGGGVYNIGYWEQNKSPNQEYITDIKIKSIKIYKYD